MSPIVSITTKNHASYRTQSANGEVTTHVVGGDIVEYVSTLIHINDNNDVELSDTSSDLVICQILLYLCPIHKGYNWKKSNNLGIL